jgi:hypothetical protein
MLHNSSSAIRAYYDQPQVSKHAFEVTLNVEKNAILYLHPKLTSSFPEILYILWKIKQVV